MKQGRNVTDIAKTFGLTERYVKQRLALANLQSAIKDAYRNGDIEAETFSCLLPPPGASRGTGSLPSRPKATL